MHSQNLSVLRNYDQFLMVCKYCHRLVSYGHKITQPEKEVKQEENFSIRVTIGTKRYFKESIEGYGYQHNVAVHHKPANSMNDYLWYTIPMNVLKEDDEIAILEPVLKFYKVQLDGSLKEIGIDNGIAFEYYPFDNFYIHSGASECITYNTIGQEGQVIQVNKFDAVHKNVGIKRVNGTRG